MWYFVLQKLNWKIFLDCPQSCYIMPYFYTYSYTGSSKSNGSHLLIRNFGKNYSNMSCTTGSLMMTLDLTLKLTLKVISRWTLVFQIETSIFGFGFWKRVWHRYLNLNVNAPPQLFRLVLRQDSKTTEKLFQ